MFKSTRGDNLFLSSSSAIIEGLAKDKGLYVPISIPKLNVSLKELFLLDYKELSLYILKLFFDDFTEDELKYCIENAYDSKFSNNDIAPTTCFEDINFLELFHGKTLAFKDMALSLFPYLLKVACKKNNISQDILILTATSGDTGKAALEGFKNLENIKIVVAYPENGTSYIQKQQMITQEGNNVYVVGINGNFDDAQTAVKNIFNNESINDEFKDLNFILSSANSINIGRFLPQIIYYFYSYLNLVRKNIISLNETVNFIVPTGNFGNILSAYYAKKIGLPINKLICASNENNILYDFFKTGIYDKNRDFKVTSSPSMDILISSNLERLLYHISDEDSVFLNKIMNDLDSFGYYSVDKNIKTKLDSLFFSDFATEEETLNSINEVNEKYHYLIDPHTAVAYSVYKKYKLKTNDKTKSIIISTASPYKFPSTVSKAININTDSLDDFELIELIEKHSKLSIPNEINKLKAKKITQDNFIEITELYNSIKNFIKEESN